MIVIHDNDDREHLENKGKYHKKFVHKSCFKPAICYKRVTSHIRTKYEFVK